MKRAYEPGVDIILYSHKVKVVASNHVNRLNLDVWTIIYFKALSTHLLTRLKPQLTSNYIRIKLRLKRVSSS